MKKVFISVSIFVAGLLLGLAIGWRSGFIDGFSHSRIALTSWIPATRALSTDPEINKRLDGLASSNAGVFASSFSFSPLMFFTHPKAESGFMDMLAYRDFYQLPPDKFFQVASLQVPGAFTHSTPDGMRTLEATLRGKYPRFFEAATARLKQNTEKVEQGAAANP